MSEIFIIYGNQAEQMVSELIEKSRALDKIHRDENIFIKPNLVASRKNYAGIDTDPKIVEALIKSLMERGIRKITVGDGSGMGYSASKAFDYCGYTGMASRYGLRLVDLEKDNFVKLPVRAEGPFRELEIAGTVYECDFFINVPVMKAHGQTLITCSLKNLKGVMPRAMKTKFHSVNLNKAIAQLNSILKPDLILADGLQGDLSSELGNDPVAMDRILLGTNPVEIDSIAADTLGYKPQDIRHIAYSADAGLGSCDLKKIKIIPLNRPAELKRFTPPSHYSERFPCAINAEGACCTCTGNLVFALERLKQDGLLSDRLVFLTGQNSKMQAKKDVFTIAVGSCASKKNNADLYVDECPPGTNDIYQRVSIMIKGLAKS